MAARLGGALSPSPAEADRRLLLGAAALRAVATSLVGVLLGIHLAQVGLRTSEIGVVAAAGLAGSALAAVIVTVGADRFGRRRTLVALSAASAVGGSAFLMASSAWLCGVAAFLGMLNAMGRDRGGSSIVEQALLPSTTTDERRTMAFAWYSALQDGGHAVGSLLAGLPTLLQSAGGLGPLPSSRLTLALFPSLSLVVLALYLRVSPAVEIAETSRRSLSPGARTILWKISSLFAIDGIGGGLLVTTLLSYFFFERFGASALSIALLFFLARLANLVSHFAAAWLARRIGLVNTMVFTHIPSSLVLVLVAFAPTYAVAATLFLVRAALVEMDVPTRQSYVMAVVAPEERTTVSGVTNLVRLATWAIGPVLAGLAMEHASLAAPLVLGAGVKILYDLLLFAAFRRLRPPEERTASRDVAGRPV
ncbi:MAG TPA: MFS transporter [Thermoanaerobaculia bacterium]|nr:MFS transporter [Thermoanaerobaculia bacterium]